MDIKNLREILWGQFGASIDMLENAIKACPDKLWSDRTQKPEFWYLVYHTLFMRHVQHGVGQLNLILRQ